MSMSMNIAAGSYQVEVHEIARSDLDADFSVRVSGAEIGVARLPSYYEIRAAVLNGKVVFWAGVRMYRISPEAGTVELLVWDDEIREVDRMGICGASWGS